MNKALRARLKEFAQSLLQYRIGVLATVLLGCVLVTSFFGQFFISYDPNNITGESFEPPNISHLMGTDNFGRDIFAGIISGIRVSLYIGLLTMTLAMAIGIVVGATSGYAGGVTDELLSRIIEIFQVLPTFILALLIVTFFGAKINNVAFAIALASWPSTARLVRAQFLTFKEREFVISAKSLGVSRTRIVFGEILPNAVPPATVNGALGMANAIITESGLSFLGISDPAVKSLGWMLGNAQSLLRLAPWACIFPGVFLLFITLSINLFADTLNDIINPKLAR